MASYRTTFYYNAAGFGWAESWYMSATDLSSLGAKVKTYNALRMDMMPAGVDLAGVRVSVVGTGTFVVNGVRQSRLLVPGDNQFPTSTDVLKLRSFGAYPGDDIKVSMEQLRSNLQIRVILSDTRNAVRFLPAVPDGISVGLQGVVNFDDVPIFKAAFIAWRDFVNLNCLIAARSTITDDPYFRVRSVLTRVAAPHVIGMVIKPAGLLDWDVGDIVSVAGFRRKKDNNRISINGKYHIDGFTLDSPSTGENTYYLRELIGIDPTDIKVFGTLRRYRRTLYSIATITALKLGVHKRGKPSLTPRGRRLARITLDP